MTLGCFTLKLTKSKGLLKKPEGRKENLNGKKARTLATLYQTCC